MSQLTEKWEPILNLDGSPAIGDRYRKQATAQLLENAEHSVQKGESQRMDSLITEAAPTTNTGNVQNYDPVMISMIRRTTPNMMAFDVAGVQPLKGPTGLIFAIRSKYVNGANSALWPEALYNEANTAFTGTGSHVGTTGVLDAGNTSLFASGTGMSTAASEALGSQGGGAWPEMTFEIEKVSANATSRNLKAEYSTEVAQDLKAIHGMDAETILSDMITTELLTEVNRELIRTIYQTAVPGAQQPGLAVAGTFNLDVDAGGRWLAEKFKGLMFQIEREANAIAKATRRGKGNIVICSSDVASALNMAGVLDHTPALNSNNLNVDDTGNTFVGVLNGRYKVYVDPFAGSNFVVVGYKGATPFDAGLFYCPYLAIQMARAIGEDTFQYKIGFKTRYAMVANPFAEGSNKGLGRLAANTNQYYRRINVTNLM